MKPDFRRLMGEATRRTRDGDLAGATETLRRALGGKGTDGRRTGARERRGAAGDGDRGDARDAAAPRSRPGSGSRVIDGEWREVNERAAGTVLRGRHRGRAGALDYRLYLPPRANAVAAPALVVMLHGCTQDAEDFALGTRMDRVAGEHGALVLYPEQSPRANPQRCWNWFKHVHQRRGRGEPGAIEETVRATLGEHAVDPARVFVAGLSAGGAMAANLGALCPDLFAAVGVHSGLAPGAARDLPGALAAMRGGGPGPASATIPGAFAAAGAPPTIVFHGDADPTVHPDNGERVLEACLSGAADGRATVRPRVEREDARDGDPGWTRRVHRDADGRLLAEHWRVHGAAHVWSGGDRRGSHASGRGPDASRAMLRFFLEVADGRRRSDVDR